MDNLDSRGTPRGSCNVCGCSGYSRATKAKGMKCEGCGHAPGKHKNLSPASPVAAASKSDPGASFSIGAPKCQASGCQEDVSVDLNTGTQGLFCDDHMDQSLDLSLLPTAHYLPQPQSVSSTDSGTASPRPLLTSPRRSLSPPRVNPFALNSTSAPSLSPQLLLPPNQRCKVQGCNEPRYKEQDGKEHEFCGKYHALQYERQQAQGTLVSSEMKCKTHGCPRQRRAMGDGKSYFNYCSISCRDSGQQPPSLHPGVSPSAPNLEGPNTCILPGCDRGRYVDPANLRMHPYCGRTHAQQARQQGLLPPSERVEIKRASSQDQATVTASFMANWVKGKKPKAVDCVFAITNTKLEQRWQSHKQTLSDQTVEEYYHGTKLTCDIQLTQVTCTDQNCGACGIALTGFDRRYIKKNITFQRFGHGFYLAPNSSKCHDYTQTEGAANYRAMMVCDVCPGNKYKLQKTTENLTGPPQGFDSVLGEVGQSLNYSEIVLYNPDSILPRFIVIYQRDGTNKIAK